MVADWRSHPEVPVSSHHAAWPRGRHRSPHFQRLRRASNPSPTLRNSVSSCACRTGRAGLSTDFFEPRRPAILIKQPDMPKPSKADNAGSTSRGKAPIEPDVAPRLLVAKSSTRRSSSSGAGLIHGLGQMALYQPNLCGQARAGAPRVANIAIVAAGKFATTSLSALVDNLERGPDGYTSRVRSGSPVSAPATRTSARWPARWRSSSWHKNSPPHCSRRWSR